MKKKILVIAAHPDDEVLGCGATMAKHVADGDEVHVLIVAEGLRSRGEASEAELKRLKDTAHKANHLLGVKTVNFLELPDNRLDSIDRLDLIQKLEPFVGAQNPDLIYTHHECDLNVDHRRVHEAVFTACRPLPGAKLRSILLFEVASSTGWGSPGKGFSPNTFVDVSKTLVKKLQSLEVYESEMRPFPHARSVRALEALARWRGASVGVEAAEAFVLGRELR